MNKVTLTGRLTQEPELKFTPNGGKAVLSVTLAVDEYSKGEKKAQFIPVVIWDKAAETVATYSGKGKRLLVNGRIQVRSYEAKDGTKRYATEVVADPFNGVEIIDFADKAETKGFDDLKPVDVGDMPF